MTEKEDDCTAEAGNRSWREELSWKGTCLTDSAISGPIPSPGKRVARIGTCEEKALAIDDDREAGSGLGRTRPERLPIARLRMWEAIGIL